MRKWSRLPPGGHPFGASTLKSALQGLLAPSRLPSIQHGIEDWLSGFEIEFQASGRSAMAWAFEALAKKTGRSEIVIPAYTCYSVPAAAVAAGLRIRLVDVDDRGQIDAASLAVLPLHRATGIVVSNLFGIPEHWEPLAESALKAQCPLIDDAAQGFGAAESSGRVGARGDVGILSFGRGKPLSALGGGAAVYRPESLDEATPRGEGALPRQAVGFGAMTAFAYDIALHPAVFRGLSSLPGLQIGETVFDPEFERAPMPLRHQWLLTRGLEKWLNDANERRAEAKFLTERVLAETSFRPLEADEGTFAVFPRLGLLAPTASARDAALLQLDRVGAGATGFYPKSLDRLEPLGEHLAESVSCEGAQRFAERILTLPTHGGLRGPRLDSAMRVLAEHRE